MSPRATTSRTRTTERTPERGTERSPEPEAEEIPSVTAVDDDEQADSDIAELAMQMPEGAMLTLWRLLDGAEKEFVDEQPVAGFTVAGVASRFGGGRYLIMMRKPDPNIAGKSLRMGSKRFRIGGPPRYPTTDPVSGAPALGPGPGIADVEKLTRTYSELIQRTVADSLTNAQLLQQMQLAVIKSISERPPDTSADLLKTVLTAVLTRGKDSDALSITDVLTLADKLANRNSPTSQLKDTFELVKMARELGGGGEEEPVWLRVASRGLDVIGRAVTAYQPPAVTAGAQPAAPPPTDVGAPAPTPDTPPVPDTMHPLLKWLIPQMPGLAQHAEQDHDPDTYAGVIVDQIPPAHLNDVLSFVSSADFMQQLHAAYPMNGTLTEWFSELRDRVIERVQEALTPTLVDDSPEGA